MMGYVSHLRETKNSYHYFFVCLWASHKEFAGFILLIKAPHERPETIQRKKIGNPNIGNHCLRGKTLYYDWLIFQSYVDSLYEAHIQLLILV